MNHFLHDQSFSLQVMCLMLPKHNSKLFHIDLSSKIPTAGVSNLTNLMRDDKIAAKEVIKSLFAKCADEINETFSDKANFKKISNNIANMDFKEYNIKGQTYSISYKGLLSIQGANDDEGARVLELINRENK
mgnify:CR=1 FL=1